MGGELACVAARGLVGLGSGKGRMGLGDRLVLLSVCLAVCLLDYLSLLSVVQ